MKTKQVTSVPSQAMSGEKLFMLLRDVHEDDQSTWEAVRQAQSARKQFEAQCIKPLVGECQEYLTESMLQLQY